ncbi:MAG: hypothetical protein ACRDF4_05680, partial [Rhabdochlamydiaceae bacterium]
APQPKPKLVLRRNICRVKYSICRGRTPPMDITRIILRIIARTIMPSAVNTTICMIDRSFPSGFAHKSAVRVE